MQSSSLAAQALFDNEENLIQSGNGLIMSEEAIVTATNTMSFSVKAAELGMKALSTAGNMIVNMGIAFAVTSLISGIVSLINKENDLLNKARIHSEVDTNDIAKVQERFTSDCAYEFAEAMREAVNVSHLVMKEQRKEVTK